MSSEAPAEKIVSPLFAVITSQGEGSSESGALQSSWGLLRTEVGARENAWKAPFGDCSIARMAEKRKEKDQILK